MDGISEFNQNLGEPSASLTNALRSHIDAGLPEAESKIWHRHPVWFLDGNPVVGYAQRKDGVHLLFWSGQSFDEPELRASGSFKMAEFTYRSPDDLDPVAIARWLQKCRAIQWDYKNIIKRKGHLVPLTEF